MNFFEFCSRVVGPVLAVIIILGYIGLGLLLLALPSCAAAEPVPEPEPSGWTCFVKEDTLTILGINDTKIKEHRYMGLATDRNDDGKLDLLMLYEVDKNGGPDPWPHYYFFDMNLDGSPDKAYEDTKQKGRCQDMKEIGLDHFKTVAMKGDLA